MTPSSARVLVVVREPVTIGLVRRILLRRGYEVDVADTREAALCAAQNGNFALILLDLEFQGTDGWSLLERLRLNADSPPIVVISESSDPAMATRTVRRGATDFVPKPLDPTLLTERLEAALDGATIQRRVEARSRSAAHSVVQRSRAMRQVFELAQRVAASPSTSALILGESGVGKEVVASFIHHNSARAKGPYVRVNLAAIAASMIEAELFGAVKGAFTGSVATRPGLLASAHTGTILLDELCEMAIDLQPKILRALEERRFYPVGADRERDFDARVVASTNKDPDDEIARGALRRDLFYRVSTVIIRIPSLRERPEDVRPLAEHFANVLSDALGRARRRFDEGAVAALEEHAWPGNVRELRNTVERLMLLSDGDTLKADDVRRALGAKPAEKLQSSVVAASTALPSFGADSATLNLAETTRAALEAVERSHIRHVLAVAGGSPTRAARLLGVSRTTLWSKLKRYGLTPEIDDT